MKELDRDLADHITKEICETIMELDDQRTIQLNTAMKREIASIIYHHIKG